MLTTVTHEDLYILVVTMIIAVIGCVDSGKSSLCGRILVETGGIDKRDIEKIQKEATILKRPTQWLANLIDIDSDEKSRGITLSPGSVSFVYREKIHHLIDNPGHKSLLNTMINASSKADISILVISARQEELTKGLDQSLEHTMLCRVLGITILIVCISKIECIDWNVNKYNTIVKNINKRIKKFNFEKIIFCPLSAKLSQNIKQKHNNTLAEYSLLDIIDSIKISPRTTNWIKPFDNKVKAQLIFDNISKLISPGFKCKIHSLDKVYDTEFYTIKNKNLNFVTPNNPKGRVIDCCLNIKTNDYLNINIILRDSNSTLAYGILH